MLIHECGKQLFSYLFEHSRPYFSDVAVTLSPDSGNPCGAIFDYEEVYNSDVAWEALKAASQEPSEEEVTSNTQWSIVYDDTNLTAEIALRRNWMM